MGQLLLEQRLTPNLMISSTAKRARKTAEKVAETCQYAGEISFTDDLYLASPDTYLAILRDVPDEHECVMVVGHNPGMEMLVNLLTDQDEVMPTAALAQVRLNVDSWNQLRANGSGTLINLWRPKDLP